MSTGTSEPTDYQPVIREISVNRRAERESGEEVYGFST